MIATFIISRLTEILAVAWIITATRQILFWLYFIQLKQYRLDRLWAALQQPSFLRLLCSPFRLGVYLLLIAWTVALRVMHLSAAFDAIYGWIVAFYVVFAFYQIWLVAKGHLKLPLMTAKISLLFAAALFAETVLLSYFSFWPEKILAIDVLQPLLVLALFALVWIPNQLRQRGLINAAGKRRQLFKNLTVIGVTGSYGKTTTKEYLSHILATKYRVLKTPNHVNVDTGIAALVLKELNDQHEIMVVEMGAYRPGEIASICRIVQPTYGIMTALSNQHLELFGSLEAIESAKFELVDAVHEASHVFANADSAPLAEAFTRRKIVPRWYGLNAAQIPGKPMEVRAEPGKTTFRWQGQQMTAPIFSRAALTNLTGAMTVAQDLGMSLPEIAQAVATLPALEQNMEIKPGLNDSTLIDSTYNASTDGIRSSLRDLYLFQGYKKIVVFKEVIELGHDAERDHRRIASDIAETADAVVLLPSKHRAAMVETLLEYGCESEQIYAQQTAPDLRSQLNDHSVVLFAGRGSESLLTQWMR